MSHFWTAVITISVITPTFSFPGGAPKTACESMVPGHSRTVAQSDESPFTVSSELSGDTISVTIEDSVNETPFKGFFLRAQYSDGSFIENGKFSDSYSTKLVDCGNGKQNSLTHSNKNNRSSVTTVWQPPAELKDGIVIFKATVVVSYDKYWTGLTSEPLTVSTDLPEVKTRKEEMTSTSSPLALTTGGTEGLYSGCGITKGCFGMKGDCLAKRTCEVFLTYQPLFKEKSVHFQLVGALGSDSGWIATGLSRNAKMGNDSVTECVTIEDSVVIRESWNTEKPRGNFLLSGPSSLTNQKAEYENGVITCSWNRPLSTTANGFTFNLMEEKFHILLAKGPVSGHGKKEPHTSALPSANSVNLTSPTIVVGKQSTLRKIHGSLMTIAWVGFVSIAILLARHYKEVWMDYNLCGTKVWFTIHRSFMLLSVAFVIAGFVVIFVEVDGWSDVAPNPHPVLGCIATAFIIMQPFIALCRPPPTSPKRPIFRWIHGMIGNGGQFVACVNMFFAVSLKGSNIPQAFYWVLITFLIFHCLIHLLIHVHTCFMEKEREEEESTTKPNQFRMGDGYEYEKKDGPGSAFKKFALGLYSLVVVGLTSTLVLMIVLN